MTNEFLYESMETKASPEIIEKAIQLRRNLRDVKNTVPVLLKNQFNFKGRKSPEIGSIIIETLTTDDAIVSDPFVGSGTYMLSAANSKRSFFGCELDNYTFDIVYTYYHQANIKKLDKLFDEIKNKCFEQVRTLYETRCCGHVNYIKKLHFDPETKNYSNPKPHRDIKDGKNIILLYKCPECGGVTKQFDVFDEEKLGTINQNKPEQFPKHTLIENSRINITRKTGADKYDTNFSVRNQKALLMIQDAINSLPDSHEKNLLQHFLVSSLTLARIAQYGSGSEYIYQVMREQAQDMNVWYLFEEKYQKYKRFYKTFVSNKLVWFENSCNFVQQDYQEFLRSTFSEKKADLILTDPPYHDQVAYLERNQLYRDWLRHFVDEQKFSLKDTLLEKEVVVSNAPTRKEKDYEHHISDIDQMFNAFQNALKENGFLVLAVNLGQKKYFDLLSQYILKARKHGFEYIIRIDKENNDPTLRKQAAYKSTLSKEMYLVFNKLPESKKYWFIENKNIEYEIKKFVYNKIQNSPNPLSISTLVIQVEDEVLRARTGNNSLQQKKISSIIRDAFRLDHRHHVYLDEDKLYVDLEDSEALFIKLYDLIPVIVKKLLDKQGFFTLEDIYFDISDKLCNGDPGLLEKILNSTSKEKDIENLLLNYCDENHMGYVRKSVPENDSGERLIDLRQIDPYEMEELVKRLLVAEGYKNVTRLGGAGDRGVDLIAEKYNIKKNIEERVIFQVKRWISNVGSEPIQRLNSVKITDGYHHGICITTSDFTQAGKEEANLTNIEMINGSALIKLLNKHFPNRYYIRAIKKVYSN
ncbi:restriction endonuclease [Margalitia sp. FSL K6-0131]|uniref:restriction endonuclease n=1 Tax=Margalitia sp. FSL K6-0131 TaxID=2954604 RepID=UPI0030F7F98E